jgi:uncharacterized membrane protein YraQ (UPF0718 family)
VNNILSEFLIFAGRFSSEITRILSFVLEQFLHTWPYLLVTIPIAVLIRRSRASSYIRRAFLAGPILAIFLATIVGAFSPFCSCSVIPLVASLLIGGVPLGPVMSFWIASPSMDPEIFFLTVATLGWELAVARVVTTLVLSLSAGIITHFLLTRGWLGKNILRTQQPPRVRKDIFGEAWQALQKVFTKPLQNQSPALSTACASCGPGSEAPLLQITVPAAEGVPLVQSCSSCGLTSDTPLLQIASPGVSVPLAPAARTVFETQELNRNASAGSLRRISKGVISHPALRDTLEAVQMVVKFMALAYFLEALIQFYIPEAWIMGLLGRQNSFSILSAALLGVPVYTSNLTALPLISGLLANGMDPGAALAFLIAGPTTTLPAMSAVWGLVNRRVFLLYIGFILFGAVLAGYLYAFSLILMY